MKSDTKEEKFSDTEYRGSASMKELKILKAGKVKIENYSIIEIAENNSSERKNLPEDVKDGETYTNAEISVRKGVVINSDAVYKSAESND